MVVVSDRPLFLDYAIINLDRNGLNQNWFWLCSSIASSNSRILQKKLLMKDGSKNNIKQEEKLTQKKSPAP